MTATLIARCSDIPAVRPGDQFFCTIGVDGLERLQNPRKANAYALCVDRSPSMLEPAYPGGPEKWILARDGARAALARLDDRVRVALISYSSKARTCWSGTAEDAKRRLDDVAASIEPPHDGLTNFEAALGAAKTELSLISTPGRRILLFTDGHATEGKGTHDPNELVPVQAALGDSGIFIDALGIGKGTRADLLELLVRNTGRVYYAAETEDDARRLADMVLAALTAWDSTVGSLRLRVRVYPPFDVLESWHCGRDGRRLEVPGKGEKGTDLAYLLGAVGSDERQQPVLLLTLRAPAEEDPEVMLLTAAGDVRTDSGQTELVGADGDRFVHLTVMVSGRGGQRDPVVEGARNACELRERVVKKLKATQDAKAQAKIYEDAIAEAKALGNPEDIVGEFQGGLDRLRAGQNPADVANVVISGSSRMKTRSKRLIFGPQVSPNGPQKPWGDQNA